LELQAFAISLLDFATSIIAGVVVFSILGKKTKIFKYSAREPLWLSRKVME
jgi:hypothetical protein